MQQLQVQKSRRILMSTEKKSAILVVSFGTSHSDTCAKTIEAIENGIREKYPQYPLYRAWTSGIIRRKLLKRDGIHIFDVKEALEQMKKDGISRVVVQPTHVLNGYENTQMEEELKAAGDSFEQIIVSSPLLTTQQDCNRIADILEEEWKLKEDEVLVLMGHGTEHHSNFVYAALNYQFLCRGLTNLFMGTVEGSPTVDDMVDAVKRTGAKKVILAPFMIVAGDHANNDLAGDEEDSWKSIFEKEGYEVQPVLKGLGEYEDIRRMFLEHLAQSLDALKTGEK